MESLTHSDISTKRWQLSKDRTKKQMELMKEYDEKVFRPALKQLKEDCGKLGHVEGEWYYNGLGWSWVCCRYCEIRMKQCGPDDIVVDLITHE
jgi:hypothetical protein